MVCEKTSPVSFLYFFTAAFRCVRRWSIFYTMCRYFSYEHFYVIYCKFWELDTDHDFLIDKENLIRYGNHALTYRIVDRIFSQVPIISYGYTSKRVPSIWLDVFIFFYPFAILCLESFLFVKFNAPVEIRSSYYFRSLENLPAKLREKWDMKILCTSYCLRRINHQSQALNIGNLPF